MKKRKGFTLIELLVVIAIIALLMAIIMPALKVVKQQASAIVCLAHLRQVTLSWYQYADNNNGLVVGANNRNAPGGGYYPWVCTPQTETGSDRGGTVGSTVEEKQYGMKRGLLYPYLEAVDVFHCPGDKRFLDTPLHPSYNNGVGGWRSYSIVGGMNGEEAGYVRIENLNKLKSPGDKYVLVEEADPRGWNINSWIVDPAPDGSNWIDPVAIWHNERSNLGFADGHAEKHRWVDEETIEAAREGKINAGVKLGTKDLEYMKRNYPYESLR